MSREKLSWPWTIAAWLPTRTACVASALWLRLAASTPSTIAAMPTSDCRLELAMPRAMWRCVTCDISCASTAASSSRLLVIAISPRLTPTKPPGRAKALTVRSRTRKGSQASAVSISSVMLPRWWAAASNGVHSERT